MPTVGWAKFRVSILWHKQLFKLYQTQNMSNLNEFAWNLLSLFSLRSHSKFQHSFTPIQITMEQGAVCGMHYKHFSIIHQGHLDNIEDLGFHQVLESQLK